MTARFAFLACLLFIIGCARVEEAAPDDDEVELDYRVLGEPEHDVVTFVAAARPRSARPAANLLARAPALARDFLVDRPRLFGPAATAANLELRAVTPDPLGGARVTFAMRLGGLRVEGGDAVVAVEPDGAIRAVSGWFPSDASTRAYPALPAHTAEEAAREHVELDVPGDAVEIEAPAELVLVPESGAPRPCWRVVVVGEGADGVVRREVFVDAGSGAVFRERQGLRSIAVPGSGIDVHGKRRQLTVEQLADGSFRLEDRARGIWIMTAGGKETVTGTIVRSDSAQRWDEGVAGAGAAVDAQAHAAIALDYLARELGRDGLDGRGGRATLVVHFGEGEENAFWDGRRAVFGDGDGAGMLPLAGALDVVAHELFHGAVQREVDLIYEREPGALSESLADVFGALVEGRNWLMGEDVAREPIRDLEKPWTLGQPAHMSELVKLPATPSGDMGGVHVNSTIPSHAAFLVAEGGTHHTSHVTVEAIGVPKMRAIWWRAVSIYLAPRAKFRDFAAATRLAAEDLYGEGSREVTSVTAAWRAVGVLP